MRSLWEIFKPSQGGLRSLRILRDLMRELAGPAFSSEVLISGDGFTSAGKLFASERERSDRLPAFSHRIAVWVSDRDPAVCVRIQASGVWVPALDSEALHRVRPILQAPEPSRHHRRRKPSLRWRAHSQYRARSRSQ